MAGIMSNSVRSQVQQAALAVQAAALPADVRGYLQSQYGNSQITVLGLPYWSSVRFAATRAAGPPVVLTIDTTERKAFAYSIGQDMTIAGRAGAIATLADTNLLKQSETRDNSDVWIWGLAAHITHDSEPALARRVWKEASVQISLNGTTQIPCGTLEMFPGAGGLYGAAPSYVKEPSVQVPGGADEGTGSVMPFLANGNPMSGNFFRLNQPFKWSAVGSGGNDSSLVLTCKPERTITETCGAARVAVPGGANTSGTAAFTPPAAAGDLGTFVDVRFHLICVQVSKRSSNV